MIFTSEDSQRALSGELHYHFSYGNTLSNICKFTIFMAPQGGIQFSHRLCARPSQLKLRVHSLWHISFSQYLSVFSRFLVSSCHVLIYFSLFKLIAYRFHSLGVPTPSTNQCSMKYRLHKDGLKIQIRNPTSLSHHWCNDGARVYKSIAYRTSSLICT